MSGVLEHGFRQKGFKRVENCLDYQSYVYTVDPGLTQAQFMASRRQLIKLGMADEERMGVIYVRGPWGFFVIPQHGYPTLRVSFFHDTPTTDIRGILSSIYKAFAVSDAVLDQGDLDE
jgi:hypothetical protein